MSVSFTHLTSTKQLTRVDTDTILKVAGQMQELVETKGGDKRLEGKIMASLFYEPSTRTRLSFEAAMNRLGGSVVSSVGMQFSSFSKGETIEDTIKMVCQYADVIAMRHPEQGSADTAASVSTVPFINAGDGPGQHPTQGLLDMYTVLKERGKLDGLHVAMVGDLRYGRTVHSLIFLMGLYDNVQFTFVAPEELRMPEKVTSFCDEKNILYTEADDITAALDADVIYMTRVQGERFADKSEYERLKDKYILTADMLKGKTGTIMHPLPRVKEIATDVDELPTAAYFRQAQNGMFLRMALLDLLLGKA
jgi:aspartate carbamoyltransferase catalytic subunit